eukprot:TRINITY_DN987_c0_g1_i2.p1 TRINITY_DN987_c0_g1~~TRINITY_DN987_c0_g1_i2.p1  ORF type:complete len:141 (-),score=19.90 TRINITY_DN987_c0_g1_i2:401-823(-)
MASTMLATATSSSTFVTTPNSGSMFHLQKKRPALIVRATAKPENQNLGRRAAFLGLGFALVSSLSSSAKSNANPLIDELLAKSAANKELNDKKRLATSGANIARAYTVQFGTCKFPYNFTGCQDLAKTKVMYCFSIVYLY